jgi:hypothetical protein
MIDSEALRLVYLLLKLLGIIISLIHLGIAVILSRQVSRMGRVISTKAKPIVMFFSLIHIIMLIGILVLVILIPTN